MAMEAMTAPFPVQRWTEAPAEEAQLGAKL